MAFILPACLHFCLFANCLGWMLSVYPQWIFSAVCSSPQTPISPQQMNHLAMPCRSQALVSLADMHSLSRTCPRLVRFLHVGFWTVVTPPGRCTPGGPAEAACRDCSETCQVLLGVQKVHAVVAEFREYRCRLRSTPHTGRFTEVCSLASGSSRESGEHTWTGTSRKGPRRDPGLSSGCKLEEQY